MLRTAKLLRTGSRVNASLVRAKGTFKKKGAKSWRGKSSSTRPSKAVLEGMGELGRMTNPDFSLSERDKQYVYRRILQTITSFRIRGHFAATLDPLREHKHDDKSKKFGVGRAEFGLSRSGASTYTNDFLPDVVRFLRDFKIDEDTGEMNGLDLSTFPDLHKIEHIDMVRIWRYLICMEICALQPIPTTLMTPLRDTRCGAQSSHRSLGENLCGNVGLETFHIENEVMASSIARLRAN